MRIYIRTVGLPILLQENRWTDLGNIHINRSQTHMNVDIINNKINVRHVTGNDEDYLRKIPRVVVQKSALLKGPL